MKIIKIDFKNPKEEDIDLIVDYFKKGKVIVYPTDTIYGIGCIATNQKAINKIYKIKKRDEKKPLLLLVKSWCMLKKHLFVSKKQDEYLRTVWPGKVSAILKKRDLLPDQISQGLKTLAVRLPENNFLIKIIKEIGEPIVSTSLNITNEKNLEDVKNIEKYFKDKKPDLIIDISKKLKGKPSKLIDITDIKNIKILRK